MDEVAILALQSGLYYGLNAVGSRVWELIQEPAAVREVSAILVDEYEVAPERCEQELVVLLQDLASKGLVTVHEAADV